MIVVDLGIVLEQREGSLAEKVIQEYDFAELERRHEKQ